MRRVCVSRLLFGFIFWNREEEGNEKEKEHKNVVYDYTFLNAHSSPSQDVQNASIFLLRRMFFIFLRSPSSGSPEWYGEGEEKKRRENILTAMIEFSFKRSTFFLFSSLLLSTSSAHMKTRMCRMENKLYV